MKFNELKLEKNILKALKEAGSSEPTPIQQQAIPPVLEGRDLMGCAPVSYTHLTLPTNSRV